MLPASHAFNMLHLDALHCCFRFFFAVCPRMDGHFTVQLNLPQLDLTRGCRCQERAGEKEGSVSVFNVSPGLPVRPQEDNNTALVDKLKRCQQENEELRARIDKHIAISR